MADITPNDQQGAFMPFDVPLGAHRADPFASADRSLCWADDWTPYIVTALKVLTRPETWHGTENAIKDACLGGQALIAGIQDDCSPCAVLPFACPGDAVEVDSPYGAWTCPTWGTHVFGSGWQNTMNGYGGYNWSGVEMFIDLLVPVDLRSVSVTFDYLVGHAEVPADYQGEIIDQTHSAHLFGPLRFSDMSSGSGQVWNWAGVADGVQHLKIGLFDSQMSDSLPGTGVSLITSVRITGFTVPPNPGPC